MTAGWVTSNCRCSSSYSPEARSLRSKCHRATLPPGPVGEEPPVSPCSRGPRGPLGFSRITEISASVFPWPSAQCVLCHASSHKDTSHRIQGLRRKSRTISSWHPDHVCKDLSQMRVPLWVPVWMRSWGPALSPPQRSCCLPTAPLPEHQGPEPRASGPRGLRACGLRGRACPVVPAGPSRPGPGADSRGSWGELGAALLGHVAVLDGGLTPLSERLLPDSASPLVRDPRGRQARSPKCPSSKQAPSLGVEGSGCG